MNMIFAGIVVAAAIVGAAAQDLSSLSPSCQAAVADVLSGPANECLGLSGLVDVAMLPDNQSIVAPINNWLSSTCTQPACTNATLDAAFANITTGCASDLKAAGYDDETLKEMIDTFKEWYPTGREVACLQDTSAGNAYCVTTTLQAIEDYIDEPLSKAVIPTLGFRLAMSELPKSLTCTECIRAGYSIIRPKLDDSSRADADKYFARRCGSNFINGTASASIKQSANTAVEGSSNSAMSLSSGVLSFAATLLVGVAGLVALAL